MSTTDDNEVTPLRRWWKAKKGEVNKVAIDYVSALEEQQFDVFNRFAKLAALYDPNSPWAELGRDPNQPSGNHVSENIVASNVDTVAAAIASRRFIYRAPAGCALNQAKDRSCASCNRAEPPSPSHT